MSFHVHSGMFLSHANKLKCGINIYARTLLVVQLAQALLYPPVKIKQMFSLDQEGVGVGGMREKNILFCFPQCPVYMAYKTCAVHITLNIRDANRKGLKKVTT